MNNTVIDGDPVIVCLDTTGENGENWRECADILFSTRPRPAAEAWLLAGVVLWRYPGCSLVLLAGAGGGCVARARVGVGGGGPRPGFTSPHVPQPALQTTCVRLADRLIARQ